MLFLTFNIIICKFYIKRNNFEAKIWQKQHNFASDWSGLCRIGRIGLDWIGFDFGSSDWIGLDWNFWKFFGLDWIGSKFLKICRIGLDWIEILKNFSDWIGLDSKFCGPDWIRLDWIRIETWIRKFGTKFAAKLFSFI